MEVIKDYVAQFDDYTIYYLGFSNGALIGAWFWNKLFKNKENGFSKWALNVQLS